MVGRRLGWTPANHGCVADAHLRELIQRYRPAVLWNDIDYPPSSKPDRLLRIFIEYFNVYCPLGVVRQRGVWMFCFDDESLFVPLTIYLHLVLAICRTLLCCSIVNEWELI